MKEVELFQNSEISEIRWNSIITIWYPLSLRYRCGGMKFHVVPMIKDMMYARIKMGNIISLKLIPSVNTCL